MDCEEFWVAGSAGVRACRTRCRSPAARRGGQVSTFVYNAPTHLMLGYDPVAQNRKRFADIGGVDPKIAPQFHEAKRQGDATRCGVRHAGTPGGPDTVCMIVVDAYPL